MNSIILITWMILLLLFIRIPSYLFLNIESFKAHKKSSSRLNALASNSYEKSGAVSKLHLDQQAAKTRRALVEQTLLKPGIELQEVKVSISNQASATGFSVSKKLLVAREQAKILKTQGVIRVNNCFSSKLAKKLLDLVIRDSNLGREDIMNGNIQPKMIMGMELQRKSRTEFLLSLTQSANEKETGENPLIDVLQQLIGTNGALRELFDILVTKKGILYDVAAMITQPGSDRQAIHADMPFHDVPPLYSVFASLQDITMDMGPTVFLPGTISVSDQKEWSNINDRDNFLKKRTPYYALLKAGDLIVYDPRVLHCGASNESTTGKTRALFNLGFRNPSFKGDMQYEGSLRPLYSNKISFEDFTNTLSKYDSNNNDPFKIYGNGIN